MSYLVLARKYRPQTFEELVGQEHVTTTLVNALKAKRLAHAYVFSGPRGCGKTTTARILAKALNCAKGPTPAPCGQCPQCREIASGASPDDVLEIDGASNRGIDQIRELRDTVKYAPARSRHRIYIIDEAHQITEAGFNALLKTLEEPPPHAVFMMATTEAQKIPPTILSRCQRFQLRSISQAEIRKQLEKIVKAEKLSVDGEALADVARAAHGSLRDALSLLDQVIAYSPEGVSAQVIRSLLGLLPRETVLNFSAVLREGSPEKTLRAVQKAVEDGFDLFQMAQDLLEHRHELLLVKNGVDSPRLAGDQGLKAEAAAYSLEDLERHLQVLSKCVEQMRRSESPRVTFELACLELSKKTLALDDLLDRLEALEQRLQSGAPAVPPLKKKPDLTAEAEPGSAERRPEPASDVPSPPVPTAAPPSVVRVPPAPSNGAASPAALLPDGALLRPDQVRTAWVRLIEEIGRRKPSLESFLLNARWEVRPNNVLAVVCQQDFQRLQVLSQQGLIKDILGKHLAAAFHLECVLAPAAPAPAKDPAAAPPPPTPPSLSADTEEVEVEDAAADEEEPETPSRTPAPNGEDQNGAEADASKSGDLDPGLKKVLEKFRGKLRKIEAQG